MTSLINRIIRKTNYYIHVCVFRLVTLTEIFYLHLIGVKLSSGAKFRGWTSFFVENSSTIIVGENCAFNSSSYTNHIGLNHRCIVTTMEEGAVIRIGSGTGISSSTITSFKSVNIGNNVRIGANCIIMDGDFHLDDPRVSAPRPINIGDNVWLGANSVVMKGVNIGNNTVIGINSVVTHDIPENCIAAGNPCRVIRMLDEITINCLS